MYKIIKEEIEYGILEDFIRRFVDEVIISKIDNDRHNLKMDIFLNLIGEEKTRTKGAYHINGATKEDELFIKNEYVNTIEKKRGINTLNKFIYNVYVESI